MLGSGGDGNCRTRKHSLQNSISDPIPFSFLFKNISGLPTIPSLSSISSSEERFKNFPPERPKINFASTDKLSRQMGVLCSLSEQPNETKWAAGNRIGRGPELIEMLQ